MMQRQLGLEKAVSLEDTSSSTSSASPESRPSDLPSETSLSSVDEQDIKIVEPLDLSSLDAKLTTVGSGIESAFPSTSELSKRTFAAKPLNAQSHKDIDIDHTKISSDNDSSIDAHGVLLDTYGNKFEVPDISINRVRAAIPKHCFERSAPRSLFYVARDLVQCAANWYLFRFVLVPAVDSSLGKGLLWALFTVIQGFIMTGLWVLAHECGHQAFSESKTLNDTVGFILHSALGVPYFSWKISHGKHHKATGHLERDQVFVPPRREKYAAKYRRLAHEVSEMGEDAPLVAALTLIGQQLAGWNLYLTCNLTGHNSHHASDPHGRGKNKRNGWGGGVNHFNPASPIFDAKDGKLILLSDVGLLLAITGWSLVGYYYGMFALTVGYIVPYFWVNNWLVWITFLQHTDPTLPHYEASAWSFTRGAAATIDREFGFIGRYFMHGIVETHVLHHFVSTIPWYHADEASDAIRPVLGKHYRANTERGILGFLGAIWTSTRLCCWIEPSVGATGPGKDVLFFRNNNKKCTPPIQMAKPQTHAHHGRA